MKNILKIFIVMALGLFCLSSFGQLAFAEDEKEPLISDLVYDKDNHVLTGKTVPNANISLADIVATITADDEGNFAVPIPDDLTKTTITIMDFLNDQSTDINYDFVAQTIDTTEEHVQSQPPETSVSQSSSSVPTQVSTDKPVTPEPAKNEASVLIWVVVLVVIVILTILAIFLVNKRKADKQQAELEQAEKSHSGRRKRRKKSSK